MKKQIILLFVFMLSSNLYSAEAEISEFEQFESIRLEVLGGTSNVKSTNKTSKVLTEYDSTKNINVELKYMNHWSEDHRSYLGIDFTDIAYKNGSSVQQGSGTSFNLGHYWSASKRVSLNLKASSHSYPLFNNSNKLYMDTAIVLGGGYDFSLYHRPSVRVGFGQSFLVGENLLEYGAAGFVRKIYRKFSIEMSLSYTKGFWNNSMSENNFSNISLQNKISIPLD